MKKILTLLITSTSMLFMSSCNKDDNKENCNVQTVAISTSNSQNLKNYIAEYHPEATYHTDGYYYTISAEGNGKTPNACSDIEVNYQGTLTGGTVFDKATNQAFSLTSLIVGWKLGLPLIKEGGIITLFLPPELAYGASGVSNMIPGNAITIFNIELLKVKIN